MTRFWISTRLFLRPISQSGNIYLFEVKNSETGEIRFAPPEDYLNIPQKFKLGRNPDMILQFSHHIKELIIKNAGFTPEILVTIKVGINGRDFRDFFGALRLPKLLT